MQPISCRRVDNLLGAKPICIGISKMERDTFGNKQPRYDETASRLTSRLASVCAGIPRGGDYDERILKKGSAADLGRPGRLPF